MVHGVGAFTQSLLLNSLRKGLSYLLILVWMSSYSNETLAQDTRTMDSTRLAQKIKQMDSMDENHAEEAIHQLQGLQKECTRYRFPYLLAKALYSESYYHLTLGNNDSIIALTAQAAALFETMNAPAEVAKCYNRQGVAQLYLNQYSAALRALFHAKELAENNHVESILGYINNNIGLVYESLKDWNRALHFAEQGLQEKISWKDTIGIARSHANIANLYYYLNDYDQALTHFHEAFKYNRIVNDPYFQAAIDSDMGNLLADMGQLDSAIFYQLRALQFHDKNKEALFINWCQTHISIGRTLLKKSEWAASKHHLIACQPCEEKITDVNFLKSLYSYRSEYYSLTHQYQLANENLQKLNIINDQLFKSSGDLENQRIAIAYEFNQKAREDSLQHQLQLSQQATIAASYKGKMYFSLLGLLLVVVLSFLLIWFVKTTQHRKRNAEMEAIRSQIAEDLHDDVGSTLSSIQIISSMMESQCRENQEIQQAAKSINHLSDKVAGGIREIVWALNPANDSLQTIVHQLRKLTADILQPSGISFLFTPQLDEPTRKISPHQRKHIILFYKEAINNARKYSNADRIDIQINQRKSHLELIIIDNGVGFEPLQITPGNGLNNMKSRAKTLHASYDLQSSIGHGTRITLRINLL